MKIKIFCLFILIFGLAGCNFSDKISVGSDANEPTSSASGAKASTSAETAPSADTLADPKPSADPDIPAKPSQPPEQQAPADAEYFVLNVPFGTQAPYANWDALHEEACEEASMIMAEKYVTGGELNAHIMEQGILNLVKWEEENGFKVDINADETVHILKAVFNIDAVTDENVSIGNIKNNILAGKLIIIPAAGRLLGNPNFRGEGPIYHMLVVKGFDDRTGEFITNDPGTRKGENYRYKFQTLINAVHDWDNQLAADGMSNEDMAQGRKVIIIVGK